MVAKHDLLLDREVELRCMAVITIHDAKGIKGLLANVAGLQKVVAPGLHTEVDDRHKVDRVTDAANHFYLNSKVLAGSDCATAFRATSCRGFISASLLAKLMLPMFLAVSASMYKAASKRLSMTSMQDETSAS